MSIRSIALAAAALCLIAGACSSDDSGEPSSTTAPVVSTTDEATTTSVPDDGCAWLGVDDAAAAMGTPMTLAAAGDAGCLFTPEGAGVASIQISVIEIAIDVDEYLAGSRDVCEGTVVDVDNGDEAWACDSGINPQGVVAFGTELVVADITDTDTPEAGLQLAAAVAAVLHGS